jgi:hypothetical protein
MLTQLRHAVKPCEDDFPPLSPSTQERLFIRLYESQGLSSPTFCNPAKDQRLYQISSTEFSLPLDTARLAGQDIGSFF